MDQAKRIHQNAQYERRTMFATVDPLRLIHPTTTVRAKQKIATAGMPGAAPRLPRSHIIVKRRIPLALRPSVPFVTVCNSTRNGQRPS